MSISEAIKNVVMCHKPLRSKTYIFVLYVLAMLQHHCHLWCWKEHVKAAGRKKKKCQEKKQRFNKVLVFTLNQFTCAE